ncbi:DUF2141 domain-containing protein [Gilvimarinus polysaccharolyticus]|uniref:DUF2141 domain-containing protein n=1 Tax=Gilvimarinus polysaccharolyticus TaxID=863921 RepID=UPI0006734544|nr:DUF2141 domain-containing protein [Gilvimarinus polysaccharolyticus]
MGKIQQLTLLALSLSCGAALADEFSVRLENNLSPGATLYLAVYRAAQGSWETTATHQSKHLLPLASDLMLPLEIPAGQYAMRAFIDINGDQTLNTRSLNRPTEPFASTIGQGRSQPSVHFERSILKLDAAHPVATLTLRYPKGSPSVEAPAAEEPEANIVPEASSSR